MKRIKKENKNKTPEGHHDYPLAGEIPPGQKQKNSEALQQAEVDMIEDAAYTEGNKNDDLDEAESASLGEEDNGLV